MNETTLTLKAGTVVHVSGCPVALTTDTVVATNEGNTQLIRAGLGEWRNASDRQRTIQSGSQSQGN